MITILAVCVIFLLTLPETTYAYLDAGTGSYIIQLIIAALLGGLFAIKLFWNKIKNFFRNLLSKEEKR